MNEIDVIIISSSRPKLLPYLVKSFKNKINFEGKMRKIIHEDFVYPEESIKVVEYAKQNNWFNKVISDSPNIGIGQTIQKLLKEVNTEFVFNLQDDGEFEIPIDLDHILWVMKKNNINCISFHKRKNIGKINDFKYEDYTFNHLPLMLNYHGPLCPGIWRTDFVKNNGKIAQKGKTQEGYGNSVIKSKPQPSKEELKKLGSYIYGHRGFPRTIRHLGYSGSMKPGGTNKKKKNGPGGNIALDLSEQGKLNRAPGLPEQEDRPLYTKNKQKEIKEFYKNNKE